MPKLARLLSEQLIASFKIAKATKEPEMSRLFEVTYLKNVGYIIYVARQDYKAISDLSRSIRREFPRTR